MEEHGKILWEANQERHEQIIADMEAQEYEETMLALTMEVSLRENEEKEAFDKEVAALQQQYEIARHYDEEMKKIREQMTRMQLECNKDDDWEPDAEYVVIWEDEHEEDVADLEDGWGAEASFAVMYDRYLNSDE